MSRISYSIKNAKVALIFNLVWLLLSFFSRRVFIDSLGDELVGLSATIQSYIGFLNLADMGITSAIAAVLYTPLFNDDRSKISEIITIYGYLFRRVGIVICVGGVLFSMFLPLLFEGQEVEMWAVFLAFYTFLSTTILSYVFNYKQNLLIANQKNYIVVTIFNTAGIIKTIIQIVLLKWFGGGYVTWLALELISAVAFAIVLEWRINREYPWLSTNLKQGKSLLKRNPEITRNITQLFSHKIAGFVSQQSQNIIIQITLGVAMVTHYGNYMTISSRLTQLIVGTLTSNTGGVGHLVAEGDRAKIKHVFWQMNAMFFWIGGVVAFGFYTFISPMVSIWIKSSEIFSDWVVLLMALNLLIYIARQPVIYFVNAYGIFSDTRAAWIEAGLNLTISITLSIQFGIIGVVAGTAISTLIIVMIWRPHYLYIKGFKQSSGFEYWITIAKYTAILAAVWGGSTMLYDHLFTQNITSWTRLFLNAAAITPIMALIYGLLLWFTSEGMRHFVRLMINLLKKRFLK